MIRTVLSAFIFSFFILAVFHPVSAEPVENPADKFYLDMIAQSKAMKDDFDFAAVRAVYPRTRFFNPYASPQTDIPALFQKALTRNPAALQKLEDYKRDNFALVEMHSGYMSHYNAINKPELAEYHKWALAGFARALLESGDGRSAEKAYKVMNVSEEYMLARNAWMKVTGQRIENKDGRVYDVLEGTNPMSDKTEMWFDITDIFSKAPQ